MLELMLLGHKPIVAIEPIAYISTNFIVQQKALNRVDSTPLLLYI